MDQEKNLIIIHSKNDIDGDLVIEPPSLGVCQVCIKNPFRYTCPRCEIVYCSSACYKKHRSTCTEAFFQAQVTETLLANKATDNEREDMEKKLIRFHNIYNKDESLEEDASIKNELQEEQNNDSSSEDEDDKCLDNNTKEEEVLNIERIKELKSLAEDDKLEVEHLTYEELQMFHSAIKRGVLSETFNNNQLWTPWWFRVDLPQCPSIIHHVCCSASIKPNWRVSYFLLEVIYAYVRLLRAFNGNLKDGNEITQLQILLDASKYLAVKQCIPEKMLSIVIEKLLQRVQTSKVLQQSFTVNTLFFKDVYNILESRDKTNYALFELKKTLGEINNCSKQGHNKNFQRIQLKLDYLQSFNQHHFHSLCYFKEFVNWEEEEEEEEDNTLFNQRKIPTVLKLSKKLNDDTSLAYVIRQALLEKINALMQKADKQQDQ